MEKQLLRSVLYDILFEDYVFCDSYEDKYFLVKEISAKFPDLSDNKINEALNYAMKAVSPPRKTSRFVEALVKYLTEN